MCLRGDAHTNSGGLGRARLTIHSLKRVSLRGTRVKCPKDFSSGTPLPYIPRILALFTKGLTIPSQLSSSSFAGVSNPEKSTVSRSAKGWI